MKIAILGTRGIPNHYGGFEQFAEYLAKYLVGNGHVVTVYNSHCHPYQKKEWEGVQIVHKYDPENKIGTAGQFIYDLNCILDSRKRNFDIILQLGYTSSSIWGRILPKRTKIITNMDGLEWKRTKYSKKVQEFLLYAERLGVKFSDHLVSDSIGIKEYLKQKYNVNSTYIPYGSHIIEKYSKNVLNKYNLKPYNYSMLIARLEPENSIEIILEGVQMANNAQDFLVIGNNNTKYGDYLKNKFSSLSNIHFIGGIYDIEQLNNLRYFANLYFHGHTVGGTNPSLLEAMGSGACICANDNLFNKSILGNDAFYFRTKHDVLSVMSRDISIDRNAIIQANFKKIKELYNWEKIVSQYETLFNDIASH